MRQDLKLFSKLCDFLFEEEQKNPVAKPIPTSELFQKLDLKLSNEGVVDEALTTTLKSIIKRTPKTLRNLFLISYLEDVLAKLLLEIY